MPVFYSASAARRSLVHFAGGKVIAAAIGISYLLTTVRGMDPSDYGRYVAVLAMCEIFYLSTSFGLSTIAQRYVAEYRVQAVAAEFSAFLRGVLWRRLAYSIGFAALVALAWEPLMRWSGVALVDEWRLLVFAMLVAATGVSFLEEVMGALLLQGYSQALGISRNLGKLLLVSGILLANGLLSLRNVLCIELGVALVSWLAAEFLVRRWARHAPSSDKARSGFASASMGRVAIRFYAVQLIWAGYSPSMVKLIVTRVLGVAQTAALGVAQSIGDMLRNYMPAHMLAGWVRPIMVARYVANRDLGELSLIANLILKLNLFGLLPAAAVFAVLGDPLMAWVTAGRYPQLGLLLTLFTVLVMLQSAHVLLSMILLVLEQPGVSLRATLAAAVTLPLLIVALPVVGVPGAPIGLALGEAVWIGVTWRLLRQHGFALNFDARGSLKLLAAALATAVVGATCLDSALAWPWWAVILAMIPTYVALVLRLRPATVGELDVVRRLFSARARPDSPAA